MRDHTHILAWQEAWSSEKKKGMAYVPCGEDVRDCGKSHDYGGVGWLLIVKGVEKAKKKRWTCLARLSIRTQ